MMSFFNKDKNMFRPKEDNKSRNFRYLDDLVHSGVKEILLDSDIALSRDEKSQYLNGIELDVDDLVIDGNGHAIDARGLTRIFHCTGKNVTIKNIILKNGFTEDGGAITNWGQLTITESTLTENTASNGGAICINNGVCIIMDSSLMNNKTKNDGGGAIYKFSGKLTIADSKINNNMAKRNGGAIANEKDELNIISSILNHNLSNGEYGGGAIISLYEVKINESKFNANVAKEGNGGAIFLKDSKYESKNCTFKDNKPDDVYNDDEN